MQRRVDDVSPLADAVPALETYDVIIVAFSGGKDSQACVLHLIDQGMGEKVELWHHDVDGRTGHHLMDWPVTEDYCRRFAAAFDLPIYFSWRAGGFAQEMLRWDSPTGAVRYETPEAIEESGGQGPMGRRRRFPQVAADLTVRWCSAVLKIDVMAAGIRGQDRFRGRRILVVTGERGEESPGRSRYCSFEPHRTHTKSRHVDTWRPVLRWSEQDVWSLIQRYRVNPHPAYRLGWSRLSCRHCIFATADQCASAREIDPVGYADLVRYEAEFGVTIHRAESLDHRADRGRAHLMDPAIVRMALSASYTEPMLVDEWIMPMGAFRGAGGPT